MSSCVGKNVACGLTEGTIIGMATPSRIVPPVWKPGGPSFTYLRNAMATAVAVSAAVIIAKQGFRRRDKSRSRGVWSGAVGCGIGDGACWLGTLPAVVTKDPAPAGTKKAPRARGAAAKSMGAAAGG